MFNFWYWAVIIHTSSWSWSALINILCCFSNLSFNATLLSVTCRRKSLKLPEHLLTATALEQEKYKVVNYWHHNFSMYGVLLVPTAWSDSSAQHSTADCQRFTFELLLWGLGMTHDKEKYCRSQNKIAVLGFSSSIFDEYWVGIVVLSGHTRARKYYIPLWLLPPPPIWLRQSTFIGLSF